MRSEQLSGGFFRDIGMQFQRSGSGQIVKTAVSWGRYAELFNYDADHDELTLDEEGLALATQEQQPEDDLLDQPDRLADQVS